MKTSKAREKFLKKADKKTKVGLALERLGRVFKMKKYT